MMQRRRGAPVGPASALGLVALLAAACATPLSAPADSGPASSRAAQTAPAPQARHILPLDPTVTAAPPIVPATPAPADGFPTPLAPSASPVAPAMPTLTLSPRSPLDAGSQAAVPAVIGTATAQAAAALAAAQAPPVQEIVIRDLAFAPAALTVRPGTTIVWRNQDRVQHQVTGGEFDSNRIQAGGQWAQVIGKPGLYQFLCRFHPSMRAEITVLPDDTRPVHLGS